MSKAGAWDVISAGNFHGEPVAIAMDYAALALTDLGNMSERRTARLVDADSNGGVLPMFLTENGGLESGFMMAQYTAAALASENKVLAHPASVDSIPSSANMEDHVSMGPAAVRQMEQILGHVETIVGIELLLAAQGVDFRLREMGQGAADLGRGTAVAYRLRARGDSLPGRGSCHWRRLSKQRANSSPPGRLRRAVERELGIGSKTAVLRRESSDETNAKLS